MENYFIGTSVRRLEEAQATDRSVSPYAESAVYRSLGYVRRSLALPFLSLAVPFVWSERPSDFFALSPVTAPVASLALPFALSSAPSPLSWLLQTAANSSDRSTDLLG